MLGVQKWRFISFKNVLAPHFHGETQSHRETERKWMPREMKPSSGNPLKILGVRTPNSHLFESLSYATIWWIYWRIQIAICGNIIYVLISGQHWSSASGQPHGLDWQLRWRRARWRGGSLEQPDAGRGVGRPPRPFHRRVDLAGGFTQEPLAHGLSEPRRRRQALPDDERARRGIRTYVHGNRRTRGARQPVNAAPCHGLLCVLGTYGAHAKMVLELMSSSRGTLSYLLQGQ